MKSITLHSERGSTGTLSDFSVGIGFSGELLFSEGTYYPRDGSEPSREYDKYVTVAAADLPRLAARLKCPADPEKLLDALAKRVRRDCVQSLWGVRRLLDGLGIPWTESTQIWRDD